MKNSSEQAMSSWQNYMKERDDLFLKSRSTSVTEITSTLAHELNQPLGTVTNILNGLRLRIENNTLEPEDFHDAVDLALHQTQFAARVVSRMRKFTAERQAEFTTFNVVDLLNQSVRCWFTGILR